MRFEPDEPHEELTLQMAPMVDVVFILLAFFVLAARFEMPERDLGLGYREASLAAGAQVADFPEAIPVVLQRRGEHVAITVGQAVLVEDDYGAIRAKLEEINLPEVPVTVLADPSLSVEQVARAMDAVLASPMRKLSVGRIGGAPATEG